ncbi:MULTISPECIES: DNA-binding transcriptional regulator [Mameliella]|uniref:DNA-binding transcriptional activator, 3HPP-binding n=2 Tax=Mameliella alba TaxID=561184 RepID=A0A0B3S4J6_9RHOB|nr:MULTISPECIES: DNA-binding transcriptional regulator [Mameliella]ODM45228.1 transcriptional regulator [Ruegeria sp. PBVC088]KHQ51616.1 DNA-binding transcriptional activator, 3HPP-binding [Mameliella alba]MBY6120306.1 DNA-binding transcriptional regulator [Mameliella alba]MDD9730764.1 DNA-binding transcriptional regulator [Mameliella sp. AT18]OWV40908.1 transcriptional regulator [Mameliella alba]
MGIRSIERALQVLQEMNMQPHSSIARLHEKTGLPKPTLVRILKTLEEAGYVENDKRIGGYQVSALVSSLSSGYHKEPLIVEAGRSWAIALTRKHHWPVSISVLDRDAVVVRFSTVPDSSMSPFHTTVNMRLPLITRGMGLAYLAFAPEEERDLIFDMLRNSNDPENALVHHPKELMNLIETVRAQGYATRSAGVEPQNSNTIAVPIFTAGGRIIASLGLTYFTSAFKAQADACARYAPILQRTSEEITRDLVRLSAAP